MSNLNFIEPNQTMKKDSYRCHKTYDSDFYVKKIELPELGITVDIERDLDGNYDYDVIVN